MSSPSDAAINALQEALRVSPDNLPLRKHLAETLLNVGRAPDAETELRSCLRLAPRDVFVKLLLARAYAAQNRHSAAIVVFEDVLKSAPDHFSPATRVAYAHSLLAAGDADRARSHYLAALHTDPAFADKGLSDQLDVDPADLSSSSREKADPVPAHGEHAPRSRPSFETEQPRITFAQVGGMDRVKDDIRIKIIHPLQHPELYKAYGKRTGGGILLYGPPGCGKTHIARATAGEVRAKFISIGINDVLTMYMGESERNMHEIFEHARASAPCVLFFDEADALGGSRAEMKNSAGRQTVAQFLAEFDGVSSENEGVLVLAATNAPWHVDAAFRRPGRFDRVVFVPPPDAPARASILRILLDGKPTEGIDHDKIAKLTDAFSGADLKNVVETAIEDKLREAMKSGRPDPIRTTDLQHALKQIRPTTAEWFTTAKNYALYANQGGLYDDVLKHLKISR
jgi:transitional endoplasmic reticulum ATPase